MRRSDRCWTARTKQLDSGNRPAACQHLRIGALVTLEQIAAPAMLRERYTAFADARGSSAGPQIRHVATLGGQTLGVLKQAEQPSLDWSIADVAVVLERASGGSRRRVSVVLGAVAPILWRATQAEQALAGQVIDPAVARCRPSRHRRRAAVAP